MTTIAFQICQSPGSGSVGSHNVDRPVSALVRRVDNKSAIRAPARVLTVARAEAQTSLISTICIDGINIEPPTFNAINSGKIPPPSARQKHNKKSKRSNHMPKQVHNQLDGIVNDAKSKLVDLEIEIDHDVKRLGKKFEGSLSDAKITEGKRLDVRAELLHCYHTLKDSGECQIFAQKLDKCVTEALASP